MPRHRSLDHVKRGQVCTLVAAGQSLEQAARRVGCSPRTLRRERRRNDDFRRLLEEARASSAVDPLQLLLRAAASDWRAAAWLLERERPKEFGPPRSRPCRPAEIDDACTRMIQAAVDETPDEGARERLYRRLYEAADLAGRDLAGAFSRRDLRVGDSELGPQLSDLELLRSLRERAAQSMKPAVAKTPRLDSPATANDAAEPAASDDDADEIDQNPDNSGQNAGSNLLYLAHLLADRLQEKQAQRAANDPESARQLSASRQETDP